MPIKDITGQTFGRLTVIKDTPERCGHNVVWLCVCECGTKIKIAGNRLIRGNTKSCGCLRKEVTAVRSTKHGDATNGTIHRDYYIWASIKKRCYNKRSKHYKDYGGRGITLYSKWVEDYKTFAKYIRSLPNYPAKENNKTLITLDRIDNDKNYVPKNLQRSTKTEQASNRRSNIIVVYKGVKGTLKQIVEQFTDLSYSLVRSRFVDLSWSLNDALTKPSRIKIKADNTVVPMKTDKVQ